MAARRFGKASLDGQKCALHGRSSTVLDPERKQRIYRRFNRTVPRYLGQEPHAARHALVCDPLKNNCTETRISILIPPEGLWKSHTKTSNSLEGTPSKS